MSDYQAILLCMFVMGFVVGLFSGAIIEFILETMVKF